MTCCEDIIDSLFLEGQCGDELKGRKSNLFTHSTVDGHSAVVNKAAVNILLKRQKKKNKQKKHLACEAAVLNFF